MTVYPAQVDCQFGVGGGGGGIFGWEGGGGEVRVFLWDRGCFFVRGLPSWNAFSVCFCVVRGISFFVGKAFFLLSK